MLLIVEIKRNYLRGKIRVTEPWQCAGIRGTNSPDHRTGKNSQSVLFEILRFCPTLRLSFTYIYCKTSYCLNIPSCSSSVSSADVGSSVKFIAAPDVRLSLAAILKLNVLTQEWDRFYYQSKETLDAAARLLKACTNLMKALSSSCHSVSRQETVVILLLLLFSVFISFFLCTLSRILSSNALVRMREPNREQWVNHFEPLRVLSPFT